MLKISKRTEGIKQSGIRNASVRCTEIGGINLGQGVCDMPVPAPIKQEAHQVIDANKSLYSPCEGIKELREALAQKITSYNKIPTKASEVMAGHGSTGVFVCAAMTVFNPGDEVILFEPFYGYHKNVLEMLGMTVKTVDIDLKDFTIDFDKLKKTIGEKTRGIVICTPCNPCGKVFSKEELIQIGRIANEKDLCVITDEIYEYITYPSHEHVSLASLEDFRNRTITISGFSKTYNMTGWRMGYSQAPAHITEKMSLVQDRLYVCPVTPMQHSVLAALKLPASYYSEMKTSYLRKRDLMVKALEEMGYKLCVPQGAYYIMADFSALPFKNDEEAVTQILEKAKVATVTGSSFYINPERGRKILRFCYGLDEDILHQAIHQMKKMF